MIGLIAFGAPFVIVGAAAVYAVFRRPRPSDEHDTPSAG